MVAKENQRKMRNKQFWIAFCFDLFCEKTKIFGSEMNEAVCLSMIYRLRFVVEYQAVDFEAEKLCSTLLC